MHKLKLNKRIRAAGPKIHDLLLKELEERHHYSRFIAQAYMTWYTFFITLNLFIMGASLTNFDKLADLDKIANIRLFMVWAFLIFNGLGAIATIFIYRGTKKQRDRIDKIIEELNGLCKDNHGQRAGITMRTSYPYKLFIRLSYVFAFSFVVLIVFWCIFWYRILIPGTA